MGAIANMRPDLWGAIIAAVPFVDVLNTMSDTTLPLTPPEWPEWGNPLKDAAAYDYIASYSPYDNVAAQPYPPILATGGLSDPRVTWWEPEKWIARLREHTTSGTPDAAEDQHGGRPRRRVGPLRLPEGDRPRLRLRHLGDRGRRARRRRRDDPRAATRRGRGGGGARSMATTCCMASAPSRRSRRPTRRWPGGSRRCWRCGLPYLVAEDDGGRVLGFAYASPFRPRAAYRYTVEDSVYVASGPAWAGASARRCSPR